MILSIILSALLLQGQPSTNIQRSEPFTWTELNLAPARRDGFTALAPEKSGVRFTNVLSEDQIAENRVLETGSGVAAGDVDGDGRPDLFFCALSGDSRLYRNLGNLQFEDVTTSSGVQTAGLICRGAAFVDVNGDSRQDLLISAMGRGVRVFLNRGNGRFEDHTAAAGTASPFASMTMTFADIDGNGTLDYYVTNYRTNDVRDSGRVDLTSVNGRTVVPGQLQNRFLLVEGKVQEYGEPDLLYLNDGKGRFKPESWVNGRFLDSAGSALRKAPLDWGLTATFCDLNEDGAPDLYVCNDYWTPDRIWINDGHGIFRPVSPLSVRHTSASSMGVDFADVDRDGNIDFYVVDMLARDRRQQLREMPAYTGIPREVGEFRDQPQLNRNTFFRGLGDGTFEEIAEFSGLDASDWSWQPLFLDVDLDGYPDLLVASGHPRSVQDFDANDEVERSRPKWPVTEKTVSFQGKLMPFQKAFSLERKRQLRLYPEYRSPFVAFKNDGKLRFEDKTREWGLSAESIRHGVVLADLDGDGDQDLVTNCLNAPAEIWVNNSAAPRVRVELRGLSPNTDAVGARVTLFDGAVPVQSAEVRAGGHYLSCSARQLTFAGSSKDMRIEVLWRKGGRTIVRQVRANRAYTIYELGS